MSFITYLRMVLPYATSGGAVVLLGSGLYNIATGTIILTLILFATSNDLQDKIIKLADEGERI